MENKSMRRKNASSNTRQWLVAVLVIVVIVDIVALAFATYAVLELFAGGAA